MRMKIVVPIGLFVLLATGFGFAQIQTIQSLRANIPFQFVVEGKTLPAGEYNFIRSADNGSFQIISTKKGPSAVALVITTLGGAIHSTPQDSHIVFDKIGDTYTLSEIWIPQLDGFLLHATKEKHEHRSINIPR